MHLMFRSLCIILLSHSLNLLAMDPPSLSSDQVSYKPEPFKCFTVKGKTYVCVDGFWIEVPTLPGISSTSFSQTQNNIIKELYNSFISQRLQEDEMDVEQANYREKSKLQLQNSIQPPIPLLELFDREIADAKNLSMGTFKPNCKIAHKEAVIKLIIKVLPDVDFNFISLEFESGDLLTTFAISFDGHKQNHLAITYTKAEGSATDKALQNIIKAVERSPLIKAFELSVDKIDFVLILTLINTIKKNSLLSNVILKGKGDYSAAYLLSKLLNELEKSPGKITIDITINIPVEDPEGARIFERDMKIFDNSPGRLSYILTKDTIRLFFNNDDKTSRRKSSGSKAKKLHPFSSK